MVSSEGFYTGDCLPEVSRRQYYSRLSSLVTSRQKDYRVTAEPRIVVSLQTRGILHGDSKHKHVKCHKEFVN
jgi:hypothetical protein